MYPPVRVTQPLMARRLLQYRWQRLEAAQDYAANQGWTGARFPWESARTGGETCPDWASETKDFQHHSYHHEYTTGIIHNIYPDPIDGIVRTVKVSYLARPGERVFLDDTMVTLTKGLYCTTSRPVKSLIKICTKKIFAVFI